MRRLPNCTNAWQTFAPKYSGWLSNCILKLEFRHLLKNDMISDAIIQLFDLIEVTTVDKISLGLNCSTSVGLSTLSNCWP